MCVCVGGNNLWLSSNHKGDKPITVSHRAISDSHRDGSNTTSGSGNNGVRQAERKEEERGKKRQKERG